MYYALAFANDSGGYELRNTWFKGVHGSKDMTLLKAEKGMDGGIVAVFEGFFDFLSAMEYYGKQPKGHVLVLNSITMKARAVDTIRELGITQVHLYLDHNRAGRELTAYLQEQLVGLNVMDQAGLYKGYEDFNAFLIQRK